MTSSLRVMENETKSRFACVESPLVRPSQNSLKPASQGGQLNRLEEVPEQAFASFLEFAPDAVVITDGDGRIIRVNGQAERMFQYSRTELLGSQIEVLMPERFRERHVQQRAGYSVEPRMRPMGGGQRQLYGLRKDGREFPVEISLSVLPTNDGFLVASAIRDVTEHRRLEDELGEQTRRLKEADRNKNEFLGTLAHELRSPLSAIGNTVEVMRHSPQDANADWACELIGRQTEQMVQLIEDLMDMSRIAQGKVRIRKVPVELAQLINHAVEASRPLLNTHKQQLIVSLPAQPVKLVADPVRLVEVFTNLLNNAAKYTDEGGRILLMVAAESDEVIVEVRDTGIGIPIDMLPRIFDPFTQVTGALNRSEGGIGIGLAMVAHLVRLHGGTVQVFSDGPGHGSRFVVRLPLLLSRDTEDEAADGLNHPRDKGPHCIIGSSD